MVRRRAVARPDSGHLGTRLKMGVAWRSALLVGVLSGAFTETLTRSSQSFGRLKVRRLALVWFLLLRSEPSVT